VICAILWFAIQYLGYEEFDAARRMIFGGMFRRTLNANLSISQLESDVRVANSLDECWGALVETSRCFGFSEASLQFKDRRLTARLTEIDSMECWDLHIPLNHSGHVYLRVPLYSAQPQATIGRLVTTVGTVFADKLAVFPVHSAAPSTDGATQAAADLPVNV